MAWIETRSGKYLVRWREPNGSAASKLCRTKEEARGVKAEVESALLRGSYVAQATRSQPFGDYVVEILESEPLEASTLYQHQKAFRRWIEPGLGDTPIGDIDAGVLRRFFADMKKEGASDATVGRVRAIMTKFFRRAHQEGILPRNPVASVPAPRTSRREIRVLTPEEVQGLSEAHTEPYRLIPLLSAWGTLRIGEVAALRADSVDGDRVTVKASVATAGTATYLKGPKSAASRRVVQLPAWVASELRELVLQTEGDFLFRTGAGNLLSHISYHRIWRMALANASFREPWPRPHDLRHTAVALMIRAGAHPKQIQARCGHATIKETMDTYGHLFPGHDDELVRTLESFRPVEGKVIEL
jgi:integrase